jgi:hypothetical protein
MLRRRRPPCERVGADAFVVRLGEPEREVLVRLFGELDAMVAAAGDVDAAPPPNAGRLFPPAFTDHEGSDADNDSEYQRLMRAELIESRRAAVAGVLAVLDAGPSGRGGDEFAFDEASLSAFMRSLNSLRLVLGSMLGVDDDDAAGEADERVRESPEFALFAWSGWMLEWVVQALSSPA